MGSGHAYALVLERFFGRHALHVRRPQLSHTNTTICPCCTQPHAPVLERFSGRHALHVRGPRLSTRTPSCPCCTQPHAPVPERFSGRHALHRAVIHKHHHAVRHGLDAAWSQQGTRQVPSCVTIVVCYTIVRTTITNVTNVVCYTVLLLQMLCVTQFCCYNCFVLHHFKCCVLHNFDITHVVCYTITNVVSFASDDKGRRGIHHSISQAT